MGRNLPLTLAQRCSGLHRGMDAPSRHSIYVLVLPTNITHFIPLHCREQWAPEVLCGESGKGFLASSQSHLVGWTYCNVLYRTALDLLHSYSAIWGHIALFVLYCTCLHMFYK